jgi:hypothetical protein
MLVGHGKEPMKRTKEHCEMDIWRAIKLIQETANRKGNEEGDSDPD